MHIAERGQGKTNLLHFPWCPSCGAALLPRLPLSRCSSAMCFATLRQAICEPDAEKLSESYQATGGPGAHLFTYTPGQRSYGPWMCGRVRLRASPRLRHRSREAGHAWCQISPTALQRMWQRRYDEALGCLPCLVNCPAQRHLKVSVGIHPGLEQHAQDPCWTLSRGVQADGRAESENRGAESENGRAESGEQTQRMAGPNQRTGGGFRERPAGFREQLSGFRERLGRVRDLTSPYPDPVPDPTLPNPTRGPSQSTRPTQPNHDPQPGHVRRPDEDAGPNHPTNTTNPPNPVAPPTLPT